MITTITAGFIIGVTCIIDPLKLGKPTPFVPSNEDDSMHLENAIEWVSNFTKYVDDNEEMIRKHCEKFRHEKDEQLTTNTCAFLCDIVYDHLSSEEIEKTSRHSQKIPVDPSYEMLKLFFYETQHSNPWFFWNRKQVPIIQCLAGIANGKLYICFCGSKDVHDWGLNSTPYRHMTKLYTTELEMHVGFSIRFEFIRAAISDFLKIAARFDIPIVFCGHSLGGSLLPHSETDNVDLMYSPTCNAKTKLQCITFGQPPLFIQEDVEKLKAIADPKEMKVHINALDIIPWIAENPKRTSLLISSTAPPLTACLELGINPVSRFGLKLYEMGIPIGTSLKRFFEFAKDLNILPNSRGVFSLIELCLIAVTINYGMLKMLGLDNFQKKVLHYGTIIHAKASGTDFIPGLAHRMSRYTEIFHRPKPVLNDIVECDVQIWGPKDYLTRKYNEIESRQSVANILYVMGLFFISASIITGADYLKGKFEIKRNLFSCISDYFTNYIQKWKL